VPDARLDASGARDLAGDGNPAASGTDATYSRVAELSIRIEHCELLPLVRDTSSGFTKVSIVVRLTGNGHEGQGEDIGDPASLAPVRALRRVDPSLHFKLDPGRHYESDGLGHSPDGVLQREAVLA
jgi:hypothetical protein